MEEYTALGCKHQSFPADRAVEVTREHGNPYTKDNRRHAESILCVGKEYSPKVRRAVIKAHGSSEAPSSYAARGVPILLKSEKRALSAAAEAKRMLKRHPSLLVDHVYARRASDIQEYRMGFKSRDDSFSLILVGTSTMGLELRRASPDSAFRKIFERLFVETGERIDEAREWLGGTGPFANIDLDKFIALAPGATKPEASTITPQAAKANCEHIVRCANLAREWVGDNSFVDKLAIANSPDPRKEWVFDVDTRAPFAECISHPDGHDMGLRNVTFLETGVLIEAAIQEADRLATSLARFGILTGRGFPCFREPGGSMKSSPLWMNSSLALRWASRAPSVR